MEIEKPKSCKKTKTKRSQRTQEEESFGSDTEPVSNLSASVDITGELLNAAIETINEPYGNETGNVDEPVVLQEKDLPVLPNNDYIPQESISDESKPETQNIKVDAEKVLLFENGGNDKVDTKLPELNNLTKQEKIFNPIIKAFTEQQLSSLYLNEELNVLEQFTNQFIEAELKGVTIKQHPLYDLLINYLNSRSKIVGNNLEIDQLRKEYNEIQKSLWNLESSVVSGRGECLDGNIIMATHTYTKATFQRNIFQNIARTLASIRLLSNESHTLHSYSADVLKLQIESYINSLTLNCIHHSGLPQEETSVLLNFQIISPYLNQYLCDLRLCISVLFSFQRKLIRDTVFLKETREWLSQLIAMLLRIANWQDHLFILNHILRCPAGVGNWATLYIQAPLNVRNQESPFYNKEINHVVTVLSLLLMPIQNRNQFLRDLSQNMECNSDKWIVVDSEGEEDDEIQGGFLRENDLVAFFNQLPLNDLFKVLLCIEQKNNQDYYNAEATSESHILQFYAFSTTLLKILHKGLQNYNLSRYNQFSKRLSRFIRHIVEYATCQWELFNSTDYAKDEAMIKRLQIEYDAFFMRATYYLYSSQKMGAWQFLAVLPYNKVSTKTLWKIYYVLHDVENNSEIILDPTDNTDYESKIFESYTKLAFQEKVVNLTDDECYYLLNTFANMSLARTEDDLNFIKATVKDLMEIGYICEATQEMCSKNARILLTHITSKHSHLLSDILLLVRDNIFTISSLCVHLYEELPLSIWSLTDNDFNIISKWLLQNSITSTESCLARMILSRLNWDITNDGNLFLSYNVHCKVALLVAEVIHLDVNYSSWAWQTIFRLKLHLNDKGVTELSKIKEPEYYNIITKGVREKDPLSSFLSILMTTWGHLVPLVCSQGLKQLIILQLNQKYDAAILGLYLLVPLFIECQESLINCELFQTILIGLLNADRTYVNMAKSIIGPQNTILEHFGYMIEYQITNYFWYNLQSPRCLVRLWINSLVSIPQWNKDVGVMYLLDIIIRAAFFYSDARDVINNILRDLLQCTTPQEQSVSITSLFKWVSHSNSENILLINGSLSTCTYLAYVLIELEFEEKEKATGLWNEIISQLINQKGKVNVDAAIKKAANVLKLPSFTSAYLSLFRWAQQALDTPLDHPLLPLLWQKFFGLYLWRIISSRGLDQGCVGTKFFEGLINLTFFKKIKKRLQEALHYYSYTLEEVKEQDLNNIKITFYTNCRKLFEAYSLWLEETRLQEVNLYLPSLPAQYEPQLLDLILRGSVSPWMEYVDVEKIQVEQQKAIKTFKCCTYRERSNVNLPLLNVQNTIRSSNPLEKMLRLLNSYDSPKSPPALNRTKLSIPYIVFNDSRGMFTALKPHFDILTQFAKGYNLRVSELNAFDCMYLELVPQLYRSVLQKVKKQVPCKGSAKAVHCSGPANILLQMQEARVNERIEHQIQINRTDYESLLSKILQAPANSLCIASVILQHTVEMLQNQMKTNPDYSKIGVELFYYILPMFNDELTNFLPIKQLLTTCLERLGRAHICGVEFETPKLLERILQQPSLTEYLAPHFLPDNIGTANFLLMYSNLSKDIGQKHDMIFTLLSKFDVAKWLNTKQPKLKQRSQFIEIVIKSLTMLGHEPSNEMLMLLELYRKHLINILQYQFPEHLGEILMHMLKVSNGGTDTGCISKCVWMDVLNFLSAPIQLRLNTPVRDQLRLYSQQQTLLHHQELLEMTDMLSRHFQQERLQYGLYGIYPKIRNYIDVFILLLGMTGHGLIISTLNTHQGVLGEKLCEIIWPNLRELFAPWLIPYWIQNLKDNMATWIQQLADDRTVLLPWIAADGPYAQKVVHMFFECIHFIIQTLPGCNRILSFVWHWYVTNFAHKTVKDHITNAIHASFLNLPWKNFWPTVTDLEMMQKVVEQYLPESHTFLGCIFMEIPWSTWLKSISENTPVHIKSKIQHSLLHLIVKLSNEPNVKNNHSEKAKTLLTEAEGFNWCFVDVASYEQVIDWFVMSCDPLVIFKTDLSCLDCKILRFLQIVAYYDRLIDYKSANQLKKRHLFVRGYIKLITFYTTRYKSIVNAKEFELNNIISYQLNYMEQIVENKEELTIILSEFLEILNLSTINKMAVKSFDQWISTKPSHGVIIKAILRTLGTTVCDTEIAAVLFETTLNSYFNNNSTNVYLWSDITNEINLLIPKQTELEQSLLMKGCVLTLHAVMLKKLESSTDLKTLLNTSIDWLNVLKINDSIESKMPLLWADALTLSLRYSQIEEAYTGAFLYKFSQMLIQYADEMDVPRWGRGILGAIGIVKSPVLSLQFKFLCRALAGYILAQLPEMRGNPQTIRLIPNAPSIVGHTGGNTECAKILMKLDFGQSQGQIKECAELALKQIQDPSNSLHNVKEFLMLFLNQIYMKPYLADIGQ